MPIGGDSKNLNRRSSDRTRFADRRTDRLPPNVWILLNSAACCIKCHAAGASRQRKWTSALSIKNEDLDRGASQINGEERAALGGHCAATAHAATAQATLRLSAGRRCGRC